MQQGAFDDDNQDKAGLSSCVIAMSKSIHFCQNAAERAEQVDQH